MSVAVADTGVLISLGLVDLIELPEDIFGELFIAKAVWEELHNYNNPEFEKSLLLSLRGNVVSIKSRNYLSMVMDYGESESVILYNELKADFLIIDDNKARMVTETLNVNCIGSIGLLIKAKQKGLIPELKPIFEKWILMGRYFSIKLLNSILLKFEEPKLFS